MLTLNATHNDNVKTGELNDQLFDHLQLIVQTVCLKRFVCSLNIAFFSLTRFPFSLSVCVCVLSLLCSVCIYLYSHNCVAEKMKKKKKITDPHILISCSIFTEPLCCVFGADGEGLKLHGGGKASNCFK